MVLKEAAESIIYIHLRGPPQCHAQGQSQWSLRIKQLEGNPKTGQRNPETKQGFPHKISDQERTCCEKTVYCRYRIERDGPELQCTVTSGKLQGGHELQCTAESENMYCRFREQNSAVAMSRNVL